jgi:hypothetical protein
VPARLRFVLSASSRCFAVPGLFADRSAAAAHRVRFSSDASRFPRML